MFEAIVFILFMAVGLGIGIWIFSLLSDALSRLPPENRTMSPGSVFFCLVPVFGVLWLFKVVSGITASYNSFFDDHRAPRKRCGNSLGMWWAACLIISIGMMLSIPLVIIMGFEMATLMGFLPALQGIGVAANIAALVLMIMYLVEISSLKKVVSEIELDEFDKTGAAP